MALVLIHSKYPRGPFEFNAVSIVIRQTKNLISLIWLEYSCRLVVAKDLPSGISTVLLLTSNEQRMEHTKPNVYAAVWRKMITL